MIVALIYVGNSQVFAAGTFDPTPMFGKPALNTLAESAGELLAAGASQALPSTTAMTESQNLLLRTTAESALPTSPSDGSWKGKSPCE